MEKNRHCRVCKKVLPKSKYFNCDACTVEDDGFDVNLDWDLTDQEEILLKEFFK